MDIIPRRVPNTMVRASVCLQGISLPLSDSSIMSRCDVHRYNNLTRWSDPLLAQLSHLEWHSQILCLLIHYVCQPAPGPALSSPTNHLFEEIEQVLLEILHAYNFGAILAVTETIDHVKDYLEVSSGCIKSHTHSDSGFPSSYEVRLLSLMVKWRMK